MRRLYKLPSKEHTYRLLSIDDTTYNHVNIFVFFDSKDTIQVISKQNISERSGCWESLVVNKKYFLTVTPTSLYDFSFPSNGLIYINEEKHTSRWILKEGETFYKAEEINGKLYKYR